MDHFSDKRHSGLSQQDSKYLVIGSVTIGGALEWYEIGLFVFWPLIIQESSVNFDVPIAESINAVAVLLVVAIAILSGGARFLGGLFFGRKGDRQGRRSAFSLTVLFAALPSFILVVFSFFISYESWMTYSAVVFAAIKFFQGMPAGGELPGAICYLAEDNLHSVKSGKEIRLKRRYTCSFAMVGPQIGLGLSAVVCLILKHTFSTDILLAYVWKFVFLFSGMMGVAGFIMRKKMHETTAFLELEHHKAVVDTPIKMIFEKHLRRLGVGSVISVFEVVSFSILSVMPLYYAKAFGFSQERSIILSLVFSILCVVFPPLVGKLSSQYPGFPWLKTSAWGSLFLSIVFYFVLLGGSFFCSLMVNLAMILLFSIQVALLPSILANLFPTEVRYTGIAFSFNICDGILWSLITSVCFLLMSSSAKDPNFILFLPVAAGIFLFTLRFPLSKAAIANE